MVSIYADYNYPKFIYSGYGNDFDVYKNGIKSSHNKVSIIDIFVTSFYNPLIESWMNLNQLPSKVEFKFFYNGNDVILYDIDKNVFNTDTDLMKYFNISKRSFLFKNENDEFILSLVEDLKQNKITFKDFILSFIPSADLNYIKGIYIKTDNKPIDYIKNINSTELILEHKNEEFSKHIRSFLLKNIAEIINSNLNEILESVDTSKLKELQYIDIVSNIFNIYMDKYGLDEVEDYKYFVSQFLWKDIGYINTEFISNEVTKILIESDIKNLEFFKFLLNQLKTKKKPNFILTEYYTNVLNNFISYVDTLLFENENIEINLQENPETTPTPPTYEIKIEGGAIKIDDKEKEKLQKSYNKLQTIIKKITKKELDLKKEKNCVVFIGGFNIVDKNFDKLIKETYKNKDIYFFVFDNENKISNKFLIVSDLNKSILETIKKQNKNIKEIIYLDTFNIDFILNEIFKRNIGIEKFVFEYKSDFEFFNKYLIHNFNYSINTEDVRVYENISLKEKIKDAIVNSNFDTFFENASEYASNYFSNIIAQYTGNVKIS